MVNFLNSNRRNGAVSRAKRLRRAKGVQRKLFVEQLETRNLMAVFQVTTTEDIVDSNDGVFSLREVIHLANATAGHDTIEFLASITREAPATIKLSGEALVISSELDIVGPSSNVLSIDADQRSQIFRIDDGSTQLRAVKISNLRLTGGQSSDLGGAIFSSETLILVSCTISDSSANEGGGIFNMGTLNVWESLISGNRASSRGGGILSVGTLSVVDSTIAANSASISGGGIYYKNAHYYFIVINSTIAGNVVGGDGGGIGSIDGTVVRMANTIVAGNTLTSGVGNDVSGIVQNEASYSMIGVGEATFWTDGIRSSIVGIDWRTVLENDGIRPNLANNGGPSKTIALLPGSRAIDTGYSQLFSDLATRTDQRGLGFSRLQRREIDMGAFERSRELAVVTITPSSARYTDGTVLFTATVVPQDPRVTQVPTGTVYFTGFLSESKDLAIGAQNLTLVDGKTTWAFGEWTYGIYRMEAKYIGDDTFLPSTAPNYVRTGKVVDFGDAPTAAQTGFASNYPVTLEENGARHSANRGLFLGVGPDDELDGKPSKLADADMPDDGIEFITPLVASSGTTQASVLVSFLRGLVKLDGWIDFNRDGDWNDAGEQIFQSKTFNSLRNLASFTIPAGASLGSTGARFRASTEGGLKPTGPAYDGEVEDYMVNLVANVGEALVLNAEASKLAIDILTIDDETIIKGFYGVLFRAPRFVATRIRLQATQTTTWPINNISVETAGQIEVELGPTSDIVRLYGNGQSLAVKHRPFHDASSTKHQYAQIDVTGSGDNTLSLQSSLPRMRLRYNLGDRIEATWERVDQPAMIDGQFVHQVYYGRSNAIIELDNATPYHNPKNRFDSDRDSVIAPNDVLATINALTRHGSGDMAAPTSVDPVAWRYPDVNGDGGLSPIDVLLQINELRRLNIPIPDYSISGLGLTKSGSGSWSISGNTTFSGGSLRYNGSLSSTFTNGTTGGLMVSPIEYFGSITVNPISSINNAAKMSVTGRTITINPGSRFIVVDSPSNTLGSGGTGQQRLASGEGEGSNSTGSESSSSSGILEQIIDLLAPVVGK